MTTKKFGTSLGDIEQARERLKKVLKPTNVIFSDYFSKMTGAEVYLKPENLQITGSYKIRGAYNKISQLNKGQKKHGLIAASAGNHAQGVAYAAKKSGVKATIVMPVSTPLIKVDATKKWGANVILHGDYYDDAYHKALEIAKKENLVFVHPFNDWQVIAGQGTIGLEILEDLSDVGVILVPVGGGGLISGISIAVKAKNPKVKIIGVEPFLADAMYQSIKAKKLVELKSVSTIADGVAVKRVGEMAFNVASSLVDKMIRVTETEIMEAFLLLIEQHKLIAEPAGICALAALFDPKINLKGKKVVVVVSGGNIDVMTISSLVLRGLIKLGRIFKFSLDLVNKPGELLTISKILAEQRANVIKIDHNQFESVERIKSVRLTITLETEGWNHVEKIEKALKKENYHVIKNNHH